MEKVYHLLLKTANNVLAGLLTLLGFATTTACSPVDEYGSPYAVFEIKGKVVDKAGNAIPGIQVYSPEIYELLPPGEEAFVLQKPLFTNNTGDFYIKTNVTTFGSATIDVITEDIDGEKNSGHFETTTTKVEFKKEELHGASGHWYYGEGSKNVHITMKLNTEKTDPKPDENSF